MQVAPWPFYQNWAISPAWSSESSEAYGKVLLNVYFHLGVKTSCSALADKIRRIIEPMYETHQLDPLWKNVTFFRVSETCKPPQRPYTLDPLCSRGHASVEYWKRSKILAVHENLIKSQNNISWLPLPLCSFIGFFRFVFQLWVHTSKWEGSNCATTFWRKAGRRLDPKRSP